MQSLGGTRRSEQGTTHVEVKSGYGLDVENERRLVQLASGLTDDVTFLGAHTLPSEYAGRADAYVDLVCGEMLAACAPTRGGSTCSARRAPSTSTSRGPC